MTGYLFSMPSALYGAARTLDLFGLFNEYNISPTPDEADGRAFLSDVAAIASDLSCAAAKVLRSEQSKAT